MNTPLDMTAFIAAKSDQLNADDLMGGPRTITITRVAANEGNAEQPVRVFFEGDDNKPFLPCKSMRRVMVAVWGADAQQYVGRSMTVYRDPEVTWGGMKVGGIRISHMTHIDGEQVMSLMASKKARKPYTVKPLKIEQPAADNSKALEIGGKVLDAVKRAPDADTLDAFMQSKQRTLATLDRDAPDLAAEIRKAADDRRASFGADDDGYDDETGELFPAADAPHPAVAEIERAYADATDADGLTTAGAELQKHRAFLPDEEVKRLDETAAAKIKELGA